MNEIIERVNDKFCNTIDGQINCGTCEFMKRVGDNRQYVICSRTERELPMDMNVLNMYIDEKCPLPDETDIQRANDPKFTLKVIAMMIVVLFTSVFIIGMCMMFM